MHLNWSRAHPYRGNLEGCAHSWDWVGRAISHGGAGYHRHYPTHHPQFGELLRARKRHLAIFQHRNLSFHNPFSVGYDYLCPNLWSPGCSFGMSRRHWLLFRQWLCFTQRFPPMKGFRILPLAVKSLLFVLTLKLFFKTTITFPLIFLIISIKMGRNRLQMGSKEVCSAWLPLPTSTLVEEVEK